MFPKTLSWLFLIYINDLAKNLSSNSKLFAVDTSLFSVVHDLNISANENNDALKKIDGIIDEKCVSIAILRSRHKELYFLGKEITPSSWYCFQRQFGKKNPYQKHLAMLLDIKLDFDEHIEVKKYLVKLVNLMVLFASPEIFYHLFYKFITCTSSNVCLFKNEEKLKLHQGEGPLLRLLKTSPTIRCVMSC